jgi:hypothetical protein
MREAFYAVAYRDDSLVVPSWIRVERSFETKRKAMNCAKRINARHRRVKVYRGECGGEVVWESTTYCAQQ